MQTACDNVRYLCNLVSSWLCILSLQLSKSHLWFLDSAQLAHYAKLSAFDFARYLCNCLGHIRDSYIQPSQLCRLFVTMHACACDYAHLCYAVSFWLFMLLCNCISLIRDSLIRLSQLCRLLVNLHPSSCNYAYLLYAVSYWPSTLFMQLIK